MLIDSGRGSTTQDMWAGLARMPRFVETTDVDNWLDTIATGTAVGTTAEATAHHHIRPGVTLPAAQGRPAHPRAAGVVAR